MPMCIIPSSNRCGKEMAVKKIKLQLFTFDSSFYTSLGQISANMYVFVFEPIEIIAWPEDFDSQTISNVPGFLFFVPQVISLVKTNYHRGYNGTTMPSADKTIY